MRRRDPIVVNWGVFPFDVAVFIGHDDGEVLRWLRRRVRGLDLEEEKAVQLRHLGRGRCVMLKGGQTVVRLARGARPDVLAHECLHAVQFVVEKVGVAPDHELEAYMLQYLVREVNRARKGRGRAN